MLLFVCARALSPVQLRASVSVYDYYKKMRIKFESLAVFPIAQCVEGVRVGVIRYRLGHHSTTSLAEANKKGGRKTKGKVLPLLLIAPATKP